MDSNHRSKASNDYRDRYEEFTGSSLSECHHLVDAGSSKNFANAWHPRPLFILKILRNLNLNPFGKPRSRRKTSESITSSEQNPIKLRFHKLSERALAVVRPPDGAVPVERVYNADVHQGSCAQLISCGHPQKCPRLPRRSKKSVADCDNSISKTSDSCSTESGVDRCQPSPLRPQTA